MDNHDIPFAELVLSFAPKTYDSDRFPIHHFDSDGDCLEVLVSDEPFNGERVDGRITIYRGINSKEIVGIMVKGISTWLDRILTNFPGVKLGIREERGASLEMLFCLEAASLDDPKLHMNYSQLRKLAMDWKLTISEVSSVVEIIDDPSLIG